MRNKRRVFLSIQHRNSLSVGENRQRLGYAAYHWGILICSKKSKASSCYFFDMSDGVLLEDSPNRVNLNPEFNWLFREKQISVPTTSARLLGMVMIGKVPNEVTWEQIHGLLAAVQVPKNNAVPEQDCVSWAKAAVCKLQEKGLTAKYNLDLDLLMDRSLAFADERIRNPESTPISIDFID
ncbi:hypothetical protein N7536_002010 [Penicillium majusculum]|nr:hypothetical protein N7536_002010 [Penicillium majusculum]